MELVSEGTHVNVRTGIEGSPVWGGLECAPAHHDDMQLDQLLDNEPQLRQVLGDVHHIQVLGVGSREVVERHSRRVSGNKREVSTGTCWSMYETCTMVIAPPQDMAEVNSLRRLGGRRLGRQEP